MVLPRLWRSVQPISHDSKIKIGAGGTPFMVCPASDIYKTGRNKKYRVVRLIEG